MVRRLTQFLTETEQWMEEGKCKGKDVETFVPPYTGHHRRLPLPQLEEAHKLCRSCPVKSECLAYAIRTNSQWSVWGDHWFPFSRKGKPISLTELFKPDNQERRDYEQGEYLRARKRRERREEVKRAVGLDLTDAQIDYAIQQMDGRYRRENKGTSAPESENPS